MSRHRVDRQASSQAESPAVANGAKAASFFAQIYQSFQQAERAVGGPVARVYAIGGFTVELRFAGSALVPHLTPAFDHLRASPGSTPALTVCLWDSTSTATQMPPPPWTAEAYRPRGEVRGFNDERFRTVFYLGTGILNSLDTERSIGLFWLRDAQQTPCSEGAAPLRTILHWWMREHERLLVHAGAVGTQDGGVLIAGRGGSGKSTTALACLTSELLYLGDDNVLLSAEPILSAHSLYNSAKLDLRHVERLRHLVPVTGSYHRTDAGKAVFFMHQHYPEKLAESFPVRAILMPRVVGRAPTVLSEASPAAALQALAPSTLFQLSGAGSEEFQLLARLVRAVPCYTLQLGADLPRIPELVLRLLS